MFRSHAHNMPVNDDAEMETRIVDFIKNNGECTALIISKALRVNKNTINTHLYNLGESNLLKVTEGLPPVWDLREETDDPKSELISDSSSIDTVSLEKEMSEILRSGRETGLKAHQIATGVGQPKNTVNKLLYIMEKKGDVRKSDNNLWMPKNETSLKQYRNADSEVKALAQLDHPNIVRYITCWQSSETWESYKDKSSQSSSDHDISDDVTSGTKSLDTTSRLSLFIQMDFCEGGTLTAWIHERNFMKKQRTTGMYQIFYEIVSGVEYIHSNKLIHRDLKPDNIFFTAEGKVKIGDFGLVAPLMNPNGGSAYRSIGRGTPSYMSPEQENERHYDAKTDIFPLGLLWFEMLWKLSSGMERAKLWPDLRRQTFPEGFCDKHPNDYEFIRKMLSHTPKDRPQAKEIKENLDRFFCSDQNVLSQKTI